MNDLIPTWIDEAETPCCRKKQNKEGDLYTITLGKETHTLRFGSRCEIDDLIKSTMKKQDIKKEGNK